MLTVWFLKQKSLNSLKINFMGGIHIHIHYENEGKILESLTELKELLIHIKSQNLKLMSVTDDIKADVTALGTALTSIASGVATIAGGIDPNGISAADAQALKASLDAEVSQAQAILASLSTPPAEPAAS